MYVAFCYSNVISVELLLVVRVRGDDDENWRDVDVSSECVDSLYSAFIIIINMTHKEQQHNFQFFSTFDHIIQKNGVSSSPVSKFSFFPRNLFFQNLRENVKREREREREIFIDFSNEHI